MELWKVGSEPVRPLFQVGDEPPHERVWNVDGVTYVYELEAIGGNWVLVFKVRT
jgi:hypothetical protein